ncbi:MAG: hypothetical protein K2W82_07765 [Candidatus Obscuribacterales bacterium]|nr:hypothetical protein [Candidatus Obscuribacterales bacterium]
MRQIINIAVVLLAIVFLGTACSEQKPETINEESSVSTTSDATAAEESLEDLDSKPSTKKH